MAPWGNSGVFLANWPLTEMILFGISYGPDLQAPLHLIMIKDKITADTFLSISISTVFERNQTRNFRRHETVHRATD